MENLIKAYLKSSPWLLIPAIYILMLYYKFDFNALGFVIGLMIAGVGIYQFITLGKG